MTDYVSSLTNKKYVPNIVICIMNTYFSMRLPDSGAIIDSDKQTVVSGLTVSPTTIDPLRPTTTIQSYSFKLLDKGGVVSALLNGNPQFFQNEQVQIWVGRNLTMVNPSEAMDFADYLALPPVYVAKCSKQDSSYSFEAMEAKDRLDNGAFDIQTKLAVDITDETTEITMQDVSSLPIAGLMFIDSEFISWTGIDGQNLTGCIRGEQGTVPILHTSGTDAFLAEVIQDNPINILLQLLISSGGGGTYDVLNDGAAIDQSLVDVAQFESVRDTFFPSWTFKYIMYNLGGTIQGATQINSGLDDFINSELCQALNVRLRANENGLIGLAVLDRQEFNPDIPIIDHTTLVKNPQMVVENTKVINKLRLFYDWSDVTQNYLSVIEYTDSDSVAQFGATPFTEIQFKGIRTSLSGVDVLNDFRLLFFGRFAWPKPMIGVSVQMISSNNFMGDRVELDTTLLPADDGTLNFANTLEVVQKSINFQTGDCSFQLAFNAFTGIRGCYIAPSDSIQSVTSQKIVVVGAGRGVQWKKTWAVKLYNNTTSDDVPGEAVNYISDVTGDTITFQNDWVTVLGTNHRIRFADYDDVVDFQKKFCFINQEGFDFSDGKKAYQILFA